MGVGGNIYTGPASNAGSSLHLIGGGCGCHAQLGGRSPTLPVPIDPWQMEASGVTASLRGIDTVDWHGPPGPAGPRATVARNHRRRGALAEVRGSRTAGRDGATLDFRGVQAGTRTTAIVMASGPAEKAGFYKTHRWVQVVDASLQEIPDAPGGFF